MRVRVGLIVVAVGWLAGWWLLWRVPRLSLIAGPALKPGEPTAGDVSVVIPARNEAANLPHLLETLRAQEPPPHEVIVVDDDSTDDTAEVARRFGVTVVGAGELPDGWTGKPWACMQGSLVATGETLVFLDADVRLQPGGLQAVVAAHRQVGGLVSVQPYHRMRRMYERLSALFNIISVMGVGMASPRRRGRANGAFGPCIVCDAAEYRGVGGHGAVRNEILEDLAMGRVFAEASLPVHAYGGAGTVEYRMYPEGPGQLVEGWSKNMASGSAHIGRVRMLATVLWVTAAVVASVDSVQWLATTGSAPWSVVGTMWLLMVVQLAVMLRQIGNFGVWPVVAFPVAVLAFVLVFFRSLWLTVVRRRVRWRGRSVPLPQQGPVVRQPREA